MVKRLLLLCAVLLLPWCVAAGFVEPLIVEGYRAFLRKDYDEAIRSYEAAQRASDNPGVVAYQLGTIQAQAERYTDAAISFTRCLEDALGGLRARAAYGHATALTHVANQMQGRRAVAILLRALSSYDNCLRQLMTLSGMEAGSMGTLKTDAEHNRGVAEALLSRKRQEPEPPDDQIDPELASFLEQQLNDPTVNQNPGRNATPLRNRPPSGTGNEQGNQESTAARGNLPPLPDEAPITTLSADEAHRRLDELLRRMSQPSHAPLLKPGSKDW